MRVKRFLSFLVVLLTLSGCARTTEFVKVILGTSIKTLEKERVHAITRTYQCEIDDCFDAVLSLARDEKKLEPRTEKFFEVFMKNRIKSYIIVMGVEGNIETTEIGIFFSRHSAGIFNVEITSLSSSAKRKTAEAVFKELNLRFSQVD